MKKLSSILTYILVVAAVAGVISSCDKKLEEDPKAKLTPGSYYKTQNDLNAAVAGMYVALARDGAWGFTSKMTSYFGSDDLTTDPGLNKGDFREFDRLSGSSSNGSMPNQWDGPWSAIYNANAIITNYEGVPAVLPADVAAKNEAAGNAFFIRAITYYYLVRTFGQLPIVTGTIDPFTSQPRKSVDSVYALIVADLQKAKTMLPPDKKQGKPNSYAASALLADVYLTMAGWPLNKAENYALSATEAKNVMTSAKYDVNTPYAQVFTTNHSSESIFALEYSVAGNIPNRSFGSTSVPLEEAARSNNTGWDDFYPEINFYLNAPVCTRTDATFYTTIKLRQGAAPNFTWKLVNWDDPSTNARHPYYKKFRQGLVDASGKADGVSETATTIEDMQPSTNKETTVIRYPSVLLNFAEASAMASGGPTAESYAAINQVRTRAGLPNLTPGLSQTAFRDSVVYERAYEFAGEFGVRWFDIVRLQLLPKVVAARNPIENSIPTGTDFSKKYLAPIPFREMSLNPDWKQNDGY